MTKRHRVDPIRLCVGALALAACVLAPITIAGAALAGSSSYGFNDPYGIASDGTHVWVANFGGGSVSELSASTGALVQVLR
jgi:DNA-binding beta-propeller fold protein YncE